MIDKKQLEAYRAEVVKLDAKNGIRITIDATPSRPTLYAGNKSWVLSLEKKRGLAYGPKMILEVGPFDYRSGST